METYLIKKSEIDAMEGLKKVHYLNENAARINKSLGDLTGITGFGFHIIEVPPGKLSTELHLHHHEDECVYILEGQGEATIGNAVYLVSAGDFIGYRAGGNAHTIKNTGSSHLKCIVVGQRLDHDVTDYPNLNKRLYRNKGLAWDLVDTENVTHPNAGKKA